MTPHAITNNKSHNSCCDQIKLSCFLGSKEKEEFQLESLAMKKPKSNWDDLALSHLLTYSKKTSAGLLESDWKKIDITLIITQLRLLATLK